MSSPIRNAALARGLAPAGATTIVFTVPAGVVVLLKHVSLNRGGPATPANVYVQGGNPPAYIQLLDYLTTDPDFKHWTGWIALNAGDVVTVWAYDQAVYYWLSGAMLPYAANLPAGTWDLPQAPGESFQGDPPVPWSAILSPSPTGR